MTLKIIFVCTGNTCRSPLAESYAKALHKNHDILSRGVMVNATQTSTESVRIINEHDLPEPNMPTALAPENIEGSLILTMTKNHKHYVESMYPNANVYTLSEYANGGTMDVSDPFGGSSEDYDQVFLEIKNYIDQLDFDEEVPS